MDNKEARVLLVDDVSAILEELLTFMDLHHIPAIGVADLDQALQALINNPAIDVLACDVRLGRESGLSIIDRIEQSPDLRARPFQYLFISGDPLSRDPSLTMPEHHVLTKPVRPQMLIAMLRNMMGEAEEPAAQAASSL